MKHAVITGSTKGIGEAVALRLLGEGVHVIGNYSSDDGAAEEFLRKASCLSGKAELIKMNLDSADAAERFAEEVRKATDAVDYLVLTCGMTDRCPLGELDPKRWNALLGVNLTAPLFLVKELERMMVPQDGRIVFIGSVMGLHPHNTSIGYGVTKAATHQMAQELVKEFADRGITVNAIAAGFTETPRHEGKPKEHRARINAKIALGRFAEADEIASLVMEVLGNQYINGSVLTIDGGYDYF